VFCGGGGVLGGGSGSATAAGFFVGGGGKPTSFSSDTGHGQPAMASASATGKLHWFDHLDAAAA
jgi:hypothetical protein